MRLSHLYTSNLVEADNEVLTALHSVNLPEISLPARTTLYHGSDRSLENWKPEEEEIFTPAWFSISKNTATTYAGWKRSGEYGSPFVIEYQTTKPVRLLDISGKELTELFDYFYGSFTNDDIAETVCSLGFDGWYIIDEEVMICDPDAIRYIGIEWI